MENQLSVTTYFQRHEQKYLLTGFQYHAVLSIMDEFTYPDEYGHSTVYSVYYDNDDFEIAGKVLGKSAYKEKLWLRSYGIPRPGDTVYLELKKKLNGLSYKQRIPLPFAGTEQYLDFTPANVHRNYIFNEIQWFLHSYNPYPQFMVSYDRLAFRGRENSAFRITFDSNIRCGMAGLDFSPVSLGTPLLDSGSCLMEIKTETSIPLFFSGHLAGLNIFPLSFSKYRRSFEILLQENLINNREPRYA
jgi:SPX domain protein involved in polyphosphate accumulation